jgi:asparagine synthase (glutamine-hydrolysing)
VGYGKSFKDDEITYAAETARIYSAQNVSVAITREIFEAALPKIVSSLEEPIASSSIVPMYFVCERARRDVKVAIMGQGPDELFGGYTRHLGVHYGSHWRRLPDWLRSSLSSVIKSLPNKESLKRGVYSLDISDKMKRYQHVFSIMPADSVDSLFQKGMLPADAGDSILECWKDLKPFIEDTDELGGFQFLEIRSSLPDELLMYADKLSMAHSLEVRVPYLDREVVEYVQRLTADFKVRNGRRKWLHRQVCKNYMPGKIVNRKKRGFAVNVVDDWFRDSFGTKMDNILLDGNSFMFQFLQPQMVKHLFDEHRSGKSDNHKILFSLVVFEEWLRSIQN